MVNVIMQTHSANIQRSCHQLFTDYGEDSYLEVANSHCKRGTEFNDCGFQISRYMYIYIYEKRIHNGMCRDDY